MKSIFYLYSELKDILNRYNSLQSKMENCKPEDLPSINIL